MKAPACDICGQPATIHDTSVSDGVAVARHFCSEHGLSTWREAVGHCDPRLPAALSLFDDLHRMAVELRRAEGR